LRMEALMCIKVCKESPGGESDGKMGEAWTLLEESIRLYPNNHRARFLIVSCAMTEDKFERAKSEGTIIFKSLSPEQRKQMGDAALHLSLAHASKMLGEVDDAIQYAKEASELYPSDPHPHMILGELYEAHGSAHDAERECREALRYRTEDSSNHALKSQSVYFTLCCLSASLTRQEKYSEAEKFLAEAVDVDPTSTLALRHLVDVYHFQNRIKDALDLAQKIAEHDPGDENVQEKIAILQRAPDVSPREVGSNPRINISELRLSHRRGGAGSEGGMRSSRSHRSSRHSGDEGTRRSKLDGGRQGRSSGDDRRSGDAQEVTVEKGPGPKEKNEMMCCCFDRSSK